MDYELLDHEADMGIRAYGTTIEELFRNGAKALFSIMMDIERVRTERSVKILCEAPDTETLFIEWLNELLAQKDLEEMSFSEFEVKIYGENECYQLEGTASGERFNRRKHRPKLEVKAATYSGLRKGRKNEKLFIECVVDV
ncbi:MAG: archease [Euryarchaeota archaeon]|nr:archease [Euryarchaeota archaeon]